MTTGRTGDRDERGRFVHGNPGGPGQCGRRVGMLRKALLEAVSEADISEIARVLVDAAKAGDVQAAKLVFERTLGRPIEADLLERIETLEESMAA